MVAQTVVKLQEQQEAVISIGRVEIRDVRAYSPKLVAVLDIEDAIALAKAILALEEQPITDEDAWIDAQAEAWEAAQEARYDAISAHWGHD